jgi:3-isopropylmalate/(R)-2-methylmalate dehydratase small subunit
MRPLKTLSSVVAPLVRDNVDTDAIIPASYMRSLLTDPGTGLFARWRYRADGSDDPAFVLNDPRYRSASILLSGANFGCGSSRENAVWALERFGIRCVIALGYSDIFYENCFKNGVLPIVLARRDHDALVRVTAQHAPYRVSVDVAAGSITGDDGVVIGFDLDERKRALLLEGIDEIAATLASAARIGAFRERHRRDKPWLYATRDQGAAGGVS